MTTSLGASLRKRALYSGGTVLLGQVYGNALRLAGNLVMTRLLYPEAFGLMLIVSVFMAALAMLSDVGIRDAIISHRSSHETNFINTAWTLMIVRGAMLTVISLALARPIALYYENEQLTGLILLASSIPIIHGFASPYSFLAEKRIEQFKVVVWNQLSTTSAMLITVAWLYFYPTVWALAANGVLSACIATVLSFFFFRSPGLQFGWDRSVFGELFRFGRWVFIGTSLTFFARQGDSLIVSKWVSAEELGMFSIAVALSKVPETVLSNINMSVLFPVYVEMRANKSEDLLRKLRKVKLFMFALSAPIVLLFAVGGRDIIRFMYDPRYHDAGWMLEILGAASLFFAVGAPIRSLPLSHGDSYRHMWQQLFMVVVLISSMMIGGYIAGFVGLIGGIAVASALDYLVLRWAVSKYGVGDYRNDVLFVVAMLAIILGAWALRGWPGM